MSQDPVELQDAPKFREEPGGSGKGPGALLRWFLIVFFIFLVLAIYAVTQRLSEHKALAQQTEQMAVPYVSVIRATPIDSDSDMVLPGTLKPNVESPLY